MKEIKNQRVNLRLTEKEKLKLFQKAKDNGISISRFIIENCVEKE